MTVGIVGAGISGLALHHHLARRGVESVVLEADDEPGGVVRSVRIGGEVVERGPQRTRMTPPVRDLVAAGGLEDELVEAAEVPLFVYRDGRLRRVPRSFRGAVRTDLLSTRGKLRALAEPLAGPPQPGETVQDYLVRSFGREVAENLAGPLYGGLYGTPPGEMFVDRTLARALSNAGIDGSVLLAAVRRAIGRALGRGTPPPVVSFEDGLQALPWALYRRYRDSVRLSTPVRRIESSDDGYALVTEDRTIAVDRVVVTTPAGATADLLEAVDPDSARHLRRLAYNPMAVLALVADADLHGAGYQVPFEEPLHTLGTTWNDGLLGREGRYTAYLGGGKAPDLVARPDDELGAIAAREFEAVTGSAAEPLDVHRIRPGMPAFDTTWTALDDVDPPEGVHLCTNYTARAGIPGRAVHADRLAASLAESA